MPSRPRAPVPSRSKLDGSGVVEVAGVLLMVRVASSQEGVKGSCSKARVGIADMRGTA